jgi:Tol biopolymer transport system component
VFVVSTDLPAIYVPHGARGYLVFARDRGLICQRMDSATGRLEGDAIPITASEEGLDPSAPAFLELSAAGSGILAYRLGNRTRSRIVRRLRDGTGIEEIAGLGDYATPALSPDGRTLAIGRSTISRTPYNIWLLDLSRRAFSRFTSDELLNLYPVWSPDGRWLLYNSVVGKNEYNNLFLKSANGAGEIQRLTNVETYHVPYSWSDDGRYRLYAEMSPSNSWDLWIQPTAPGEKPFPFLSSPATEVQGRFSPDGKWIAYTSNESGTDQVYVQAFEGRPASGARLLISPGFGRQPRWRGDGREIFYLAADGKLMAVAVKPTGTSLELGAPVPLFDARSAPVASAARYNYDVTRDGRQFYILARDENEKAIPVTMLLDWEGGLKK